MAFLKKVGVIHCDLKPENILFTDDKCSQVKLIDFGSSCMNYKTGFTYVQSRYYRAPEIVLGLPYNQAADMWSFGCIIAELKSGRPLFPAVDENELLEFFIMMIGIPTSEMVERAKKKARFFDKDHKLIRSKNSRISNTTKR
jgi:dual specificity tyrosine-phosphorylation-regulated kinase 2/3/4